MRLFIPAAFAALLLLGSPAHGDEAAPAVSQLNPAAFLESKATIEKELRSGDLYREIEDADKDQVLSALDRMAATLDGVTRFDQLTPEQRLQVFNDQELVNTLLTAARDESRLVCQRRGTVGTRFKTTHCETVKERRERARTAQDMVRQYMRPTVKNPGG